MKFLEDLSAFLEQRLEDFLAANPGLKLQILLLEVEQQETETSQLLQSLTAQKQRAEQDILGLVDEMRKWTERMQKAEAAHRPDLAQAARQREQDLRQRGNLLWQQMTQSQQQIPATQALLEKIKVRRQEIQAEIRKHQTQAPPPPFSKSASAPSPPSSFGQSLDPLEAMFREMELKEALEELKRNMSL